jgi:hypothetical protein
MATKHRDPTPATVKELYANAYRCAVPSCKRPLYRVDGDTGVGTLMSCSSRRVHGVAAERGTRARHRQLFVDRTVPSA